MLYCLKEALPSGSAARKKSSPPSDISRRPQKVSATFRRSQPPAEVLTTFRRIPPPAKVLATFQGLEDRIFSLPIDSARRLAQSHTQAEFNIFYVSFARQESSVHGGVVCLRYVPFVSLYKLPLLCSQQPLSARTILHCHSSLLLLPIATSALIGLTLESTQLAISRKHEELLPRSTSATSRSLLAGAGLAP